MATTLEQYLRANFQRGIVDFRVRALAHDESAQFFIHPMDKDGATVDFRVKGNELTTTGVACPAQEEGVELSEVQAAVDEVYGGDIDAALAGGLIDQEIADDLKAAKA